MPPTKRFRSQAELEDHFRRHVTEKKEFSYADADEYKAAAIAFLERPLDANTEDCERIKQGKKTIIRFDKVTHEICYLHEGGFIGSYYLVKKKDPYKYFQEKCNEK